MMFIKLTKPLILLAVLIAPACVTFASELESLSYRMELPKDEKPVVEWGRDPFVPLVGGFAGPDLRLSAIFYNATNPSAIINDTIVYEGGTIEGQKVIDIAKTHVILQGTTGRTTIEITAVPELRDASKKSP